MKKVILLFVCVGIIYCSFAQETPRGTFKPILTKEEYLKKSKRQRTTGIVMISAGAAISIAGLAMALEVLKEDSYYDNTLLTMLIVGGPAIMLGSIGFFVPAHINKRRALSVSFKNEHAPQLQRNMVFYKCIPSLTLKISL